MRNQPVREEPQFLNIRWKVGVQGWKDGAEGAEGAAIITGTPRESVGTRGVILNVPGLYRSIFLTGQVSEEAGGHWIEVDGSQNSAGWVEDSCSL